MADEGQRRREAVSAGYRGDEISARAALADPAAKVRSTALGALSRMGSLQVGDLHEGLADADPGVRRRAAQLAAAVTGTELAAALDDQDAGVVEMAAWSLGERGEAAAVPALCDLVGRHPDPLCRESAVAALGAIGDERGLPAILSALEDKPTIRRRAVIALAPFEGPAVDRALSRASQDRDWQVRQAAEDLSARLP